MWSWVSHMPLSACLVSICLASRVRVHMYLRTCSNSWCPTHKGIFSSHKEQKWLVSHCQGEHFGLNLANNSGSMSPTCWWWVGFSTLLEKLLKNSCDFFSGLGHSGQRPHVNGPGWDVPHRHCHSVLQFNSCLDWWTHWQCHQWDDKSKTLFSIQLRFTFQLVLAGASITSWDTFSSLSPVLSYQWPRLGFPTAGDPSMSFLQPSQFKGWLRPCFILVIQFNFVPKTSCLIDVLLL